MHSTRAANEINTTRSANNQTDKLDFREVKCIARKCKCVCEYHVSHSNHNDTEFDEA